MKLSRQITLYLMPKYWLWLETSYPREIFEGVDNDSLFSSFLLDPQEVSELDKKLMEPRQVYVSSRLYAAIGSKELISINRQVSQLYRNEWFTWCAAKKYEKLTESVDQFLDHYNLYEVENFENLRSRNRHKYKRIGHR